MKKRTIELENLNGNVLHFSSSKHPLDFTIESILIEVFFDNDNYPSIQSNSGSIIYGTPGQANPHVFILPNLGDKAKIVIEGNDQAILESVLVADMVAQYLNYGDTSGITRIIQAFLESLRLRNHWGATFFNRESAMIDIHSSNAEHFRILDGFLRAYIDRQDVRANHKLMKQNKQAWIERDLATRNELDSNWTTLQQYCSDNFISLSGIVRF